MSKKADDKVRERIKEYLAEHIEDFLADIDAMESPKDRMQARQKLLDYVMPKVQAVRTAETTAQSAEDFMRGLGADLYDE